MPEKTTTWVEFRTHAHIPADRGSVTLCGRTVLSRDTRTEKPTRPKCEECIRLGAILSLRMRS